MWQCNTQDDLVDYDDDLSQNPGHQDDQGSVSPALLSVTTTNVLIFDIVLVTEQGATHAARASF